MKKETKEKQNTKTETKKLSKKTKTKTQNKTLKENLEIEIARTLSIFQRNLKGERVLERPLAIAAMAKLLSGLTSSFLKEFIIH